MDKHVSCYFSFRSPYSWLAMFRLGKIVDQLPVTFEYIPIFPPRGRKISIEGDPKKLQYVREDIERHTIAYGLKVRFPQPFDMNWLVPHAAFLYANDLGKGLEFCNSMYLARFSEGEDIGNGLIISKTAVESGLDGDAVMNASKERSFHRRILKGMAGLADANIFGVPTFIYNNRQYWGNDRLEWLIRDININNDIEIPDLVDNPMARPY